MLGETMAVRLGHRELALPVSCNIQEIPLVRTYVAEGSQRLEWSSSSELESARCEVARALRLLADSLDTRRRTAEQET